MIPPYLICKKEKVPTKNTRGQFDVSRRGRITNTTRAIPKTPMNRTAGPARPIARW